MTTETEGTFDSWYGRKILFIARGLVLGQRDPLPLLDLLSLHPLEPVSLEAYREAASHPLVQSIVECTDPTGMVEAEDGTSVRLAMGLAWAARRVSVKDAPLAIELCKAASHATLALPRPARGYVSPDVLGVIESARGNAFRRMERFAESSAAFRRAYSHLLSGVCASPLLAEHLSLWSSLLLDEGRLGAAQSCLKISVALASDQKSSGLILVKQGNLIRELGEPAAAEKAYREAWDRVDPGFHRLLAQNLALVCAEQGDFQGAQEHLGSFSPALDDSPFQKAITLRIEGLTLQSLGEATKADERLTQAAQAFEACSDLQGVALCYLDRCEFAARRNQWSEVEKLSRSALELLALLGLHGHALAAWSLYSQTTAARSVALAGILDFRRRFPGILRSSRGQLLS
ncbi:MAG: hypothetical protein K0U98_06185 [Deltaproteobacteria bacterium]|nr:hypothetical protein [Deltaproteobacteria bacterium]